MRARGGASEVNRLGRSGVIHGRFRHGADGGVDGGAAHETARLLHREQESVHLLTQFDIPRTRLVKIGGSLFGALHLQRPTEDRFDVALLMFHRTGPPWWLS